MTRRRARSAPALLAAVLALAAAARTAPAQEAPVTGELSLERALERARAGNPELLAQQNDLEVARGAVSAARGEFLPTLSAGMNV
ncbi:MAG TPA: TolC family protein, partial [Longimicrobium sp.]|nr:TolC family protein [Longimicrobium sp.]